jgi:RNA polymerase sigma-70 factor (ECF subfamily)
MASWEALVREHGPLVLRAAWRVLRDVQEAEDVAQEVLLELYRARPEPRDYRPGLLRCMAVRRAVDRLRRRRPGVSVNGLAVPDPGGGPEEEAAGRELAERLRAGVALLPPRQAEVFCLRFLHGLSYDEIAAGLGVSRDAVAVALHEARARLRAHLGAALEETLP